MQNPGQDAAGSKTQVGAVEKASLDLFFFLQGTLQHTFSCALLKQAKGSANFNSGL